ncbi:two-component regulator propeller domain-containing protein [Flavisericum labens]|uniref:two-component regulator propeller domain-containing protein n=1 Tax=Flavisericum labens TaxID=3377112 RepID=UPI00387AACC8
MNFTKIYISIALTVFSLFVVLGQQNYSSEQFLVEDGLPHNIVNQVIQDKKGFIWIATTNGLSRYNGYTFTNFKPKPVDDIIMNNNRVNKIVEDTFGRIWMRCEAIQPEVYCFSPKSESFWGTELIPELKSSKFSIRQIQAKKSGSVWLLSQNNGCIRVTDSLFNTKIYQKAIGNLKSTTVYAVHEDSDLNSWLLTNNGITMVSPSKSNENPKHFFYGLDTPLEFHSAIEINDEIWFGGTDGTIAKYTKGSGNFRTKSIELNAKIIRLEKLDQQTILAVTDQKGFCSINIFTGEIEIFTPKTIPNLKTKNLTPISFTKNHQLWFMHNKEKGIYLFNFRNKKLYYYPSKSASNNPISAPSNALVLTDRKGDVWVQPYGGSFSKFNPTTHKITPLTPPNKASDSNFLNSFHTAFFDKQGFLWYNTHSSGLYKITFSEYNFKASPLNSNTTEQPRNVRSIFQDSKENIWVGTKQNQVWIFDKHLNPIGAFSPSGHLNKNAVWNNTAYSIIEDNNQNIWIGTRGDGLYKLTPTNEPFNYKVKHFVHNTKNPFSISSNNIYSVFEGYDGLIWVGTFDGLNVLENKNSEQVQFINHKNKWTNYPIDNFGKIRCINETKEGFLLVGSTGGLIVLSPNRNSPNSLGKIRTYRIDNHPSNGLKSNDIIDICITSNEETFLATADGGLSKVTQKDTLGYPIKFKSYGKNDGLPSNNLLSIVEDNNGKIWATTDYMITRFNPSQEYFEVFPEIKWTVSNNNFSEATKFQLASGELLFGYSQGILHFYPDQIKSNYNLPYLALTDFSIFNKKVSSNKNLSPLITSIDNTEHLVLTHKQNFFNIEFASLDYKNPENIKYAYTLEGFDEGWNYVNNQRTAYYTNVTKGKYTFKVKSTNSQGNWVDNERQLNITVKPSIWNTTFAYVIYTIGVLGLLLLVIHTILTIYRLKTNAKVEKKMFALKQKFFIDISHELRTPLTLISAPIEYLINDNRTPEIIKKQLTYVSQSTNRLQRLVDQILDFRKIQDLKMRVSKINFSHFIEEIFNNFTEVAQEKNIKFTLESEWNNIELWADKSGVEKIVMNLLSNAFKYTPEEKSISIKIDQDDKYVSFHVIDEGIGISKENLSSLFTRFVAFNKNKSNPSTGIGLSMVKEIVDKHNGKLHFESEENKGTLFSVYFKKGKNHFPSEVEFVENKTNEDILNKKPKPDQNKPDKNIEKIKILVVEDDFKLRNFIRNILETDYLVIEAENGEKGYQLILDKNPDFVISDIMMPKLNGVDLLKRIRKNIETSHVPVILLTAKTNIESKLEGLSYGADDYITKPFSVSYLKVRILNLLEQRKRLQSIYYSFDKTVTKDFNPKPFLLTDQDEEIMSKVMESIEQNMDNNNFSVEDLGTKVGLNRTSFYYKIKSLTGLSPVEFIRDVRLKRAAQLITDSQLLIKEIAFMTGFIDIKYFSKSFKTKFNTTPTEYRKKHK